MKQTERADKGKQWSSNNSNRKKNRKTKEKGKRYGCGFSEYESSGANSSGVARDQHPVSPVLGRERGVHRTLFIHGSRFDNFLEYQPRDPSGLSRKKKQV